MIIHHFPKIEKKVQAHHGETALYQTIWARGDAPEEVKTFTDFVRITLKPGGTNRLHVHDDKEQVYIILQGEGEVQVGDEREKVKAGDAIFLPAKIDHGFFNTGEKTAKVLLLGARLNPL